MKVNFVDEQSQTFWPVLISQKNGKILAKIAKFNLAKFNPINKERASVAGEKSSKSLRKF